MTQPTPPDLLTEIEAARGFVRGCQNQGERVGLVPTMGALHEGHLSLVRAAKGSTDRVVVTIFVNPIQFGPSEDYEKYPQTLDQDRSALAGIGVDAVFAPNAKAMYPDGQPLTYVIPEGLDENLCGLARPGHFRGVCTVVAKLFNILPVDEAFFGRKDAQQAAILRRMAADLNFPMAITVCPTVREPDGLAMSSRNKYLEGDDRRRALALYRSLEQAKQLISGGERRSDAIAAAMRDVFASFGVEPEYVSIVSSHTMKDLDEIQSEALVAVAAEVGAARLIDNMLVKPERARFEL